jgi:hypothetical protein
MAAKRKTAPKPKAKTSKRKTAAKPKAKTPAKPRARRTKTSPIGGPVGCPAT